MKLAIIPRQCRGRYPGNFWEWRFSTLGMPSRTSYATRITRLNCIGSHGPKVSARLERTAAPGERFHPLWEREAIFRRAGFLRGSFFSERFLPFFQHAKCETGRRRRQLRPNSLSFSARLTILIRLRFVRALEPTRPNRGAGNVTIGKIAPSARRCRISRTRCRPVLAPFF